MLASPRPHSRTADLDIEHSLRWHDPDRFNGYLLSQHLAGTPVDAVNLRDALRAVKKRAPLQLGALRLMGWPRIRQGNRRPPSPPSSLANPLELGKRARMAPREWLHVTFDDYDI
jgi:hypothetical protein